MKLDLESIEDNLDLVAPVVAEAIEKYGLAEEISVAEIDPAYSDTAAFCEQYEWRPEDGANCVIVEAKRGGERRLAACLVLATTRADINGVVKKYLNARGVSMAPMERALAETKMEYGGVTPIGLPEEWPILVDGRIRSAEKVLVGGGNRETKLVFPGRVLEKIPNVVFLEGLGKEIETGS